MNIDRWSKKFVATIMIIAVVSGLRSQDLATFSRQLIHSTVRLNVLKTDGKKYTGTGFFLQYPATTNTVIPVVVTCWHVVSDGVAGGFYINCTQSNGVGPEARFAVVITNGFESNWIRHPDTNVDLAILPISSYLRDARQSQLSLQFSSIDFSIIADHDRIQNGGAFQDITFIGYPIGLADELNNLPVVRRGLTASDPAVHYEGQRKFLIDAAVLHGSSGSPVLLFDTGLAAGGSIRVYPSAYLIGIISEGVYLNQNGTVTIKEIPSSLDISVTTEIPLNLGAAISADCLKDFQPILQELVSQKTNTTPATR